tara:strand:+ start:3184 stop:3936 length:753 start_codon:yes stop_codon:yes gene_type:complete
MKKEYRILVIGETCRDIFHYGTVSRLAPEAPAPVFCTQENQENAGMAMNVRNNILSLGVDCDIVTNDNWREVTKVRFIDKRTNHMFLRVDTGDDKYEKIDIENVIQKIGKYDAVVISDYCKGFLQTGDIKAISESHPRVFLDTKRVINSSWTKNIKFIKINFSEFEKTKHTLSKNIRKKMIITLGKDGCQYRGKFFSVPEVEIKDLSGAGDTFIAALCANYVKTEDIEESIVFANKCATEVVQKRGVSII